MIIFKRVRFSTFLFVLLGVCAQPANASQDDLTWLELTSSKQMTRSFLEYGLLAVRSLVDLTYEEMLIDLRECSVEISDLELMLRAEDLVERLG